jgi:type IV pilus assembly protein PilY1
MDKIISNLNIHIRVLLLSMGLVAFTGGTAIADDTELFVAGEDTNSDKAEARPNILFVIDTSGSMGTEVVTQLTYDEATDVDGCYRSDAVYWSNSDNEPSCDSILWFYKSANLCQSSAAKLNTLGEYQGDIRQWRVRSNQDDIWVNLRANDWSGISDSDGKHSRFVECEDDRGISGVFAGDGKYAGSGDAGPYADNADTEPKWNQSRFLFNGNYLNWAQLTGSVTTTRIDIVKDVTSNLINNLTDVNVGLMRFNNTQGGPILHAVENVDDARTSLIASINGLSADGWTPLSETYYEAALYFKGMKADYGAYHENKSDPASLLSGGVTYDTPLDFACQKNFVIFLTDGEPTEDTDAETKAETMIGAQCAGDSQGKCLDELAGHMFDTDISPLYGDQNVTTYTIGFTVDLPLLRDTANKGGGEYYLADNTATLTSALTKISVSILDLSSTFTAPAVPVNAFNRTQNLDDVFVSVFQPSTTINWPGNLKKYKLVGNQLVDQNADPAVDPATGFFLPTAQSYWSDSIDGSQPTEGGAANELPVHTERKLYSNFVSGDLTAAANRIWTGQGILPAELGAPDQFDAALSLSEVDKTILWMNGLDLTDDNDNGATNDIRKRMGDPLHVRPAPVIYGGTAVAPDMVVFTATNEGYLHAIDADDGSELWSFIPQKLLPLTYARYLDGASATRTYGLDGDITAHVLNDDHVPGISGAERVILVFGQRRGGDSVFAVEVTDRADPQLLWEINSSTTGFAELAQTWSTPQIGRVNVGGTSHDVAFFGGGYDTRQDWDNFRWDTVGRAIYMVDLLTGDKLWSAGPTTDHDLHLSGMGHSIPAPLKVLDMNNDGYSDRIYVGDMGGRVWRYDLFNGGSGSTLGQGGIVATLGAADIAAASRTAADLRRFYNQVDVVDVPMPGYRYLALNLGSGYRSHPLDRNIQEEFYSLRDVDIFRQKLRTEYVTPITRAAMVDITADTGIDIPSDSGGWYMRMTASGGEKVLGRSITLNGVVLFTSFAPGVGANACTAVEGQNRLYKVNLLSGDPFANLDESTDEDNLTTTDRWTDLDQGGIAPEVVLLFDEVVTGCVGTECDDAGVPAPAARTYWTQDGAQ